MGLLTNISSTALLSSLIEKAGKSLLCPEYKPSVCLLSPKMPETCPNTVRVASFHVEKFRDRVKISEN